MLRTVRSVKREVSDLQKVESKRKFSSILRNKRFHLPWVSHARTTVYKHLVKAAPPQNTVMNLDGSAVLFSLYIG